MGNHLFTGGTELARELGLDASYVYRMFKAGKTEGQIRQEAASRRGAGLTPQALGSKVGKAKKRQAQAAQVAAAVASSKEYVPTRGRRGKTVAAPVTGNHLLVPSTQLVDDKDEDDNDGFTVPAGVEDYYKAKERNERAKADERELIVAQRRGLLLPRSQVDLFIKSMIIKARGNLTRIGPDLQDRLGMETSAAKCGQMVTGAVERALAELSEWQG